MVRDPSTEERRQQLGLPRVLLRGGWPCHPFPTTAWCPPPQPVGGERGARPWFGGDRCECSLPPQSQVREAPGEWLLELGCGGLPQGESVISLPGAWLEVRVGRFPRAPCLLLSSKSLGGGTDRLVEAARAEARRHHSLVSWGRKGGVSPHPSSRHSRRAVNTQEISWMQ